MARRVELGANEVLVYKGMEIDRAVLNAIVDTNKRLLWAFVVKDGDIRAMPYTEAEVIWMAETDILKEQDVEL
jgi:hypothetical protein